MAKRRRRRGPGKRRTRTRQVDEQLPLEFPRLLEQARRTGTPAAWNSVMACLGHKVIRTGPKIKDYHPHAL